MELDFNKVKVLLVDDDENFAFALKTLLKSKGLEIESFSNPEEALEHIKNNKFDMILLDYYMPQMTGEQFLIKLREFDKETIVFLQTAFSEEKPEYEMLQSLNIQGYIDKNKDPNDIFLDIASGVKMANLLSFIKKQEKEIAMLKYKKSILGELIGHLVNEAQDQIVSISAINKSIEENNSEYETETRVIGNSVKKIEKLFKALSFENDSNMNICDFKENIEVLLKSTVLLNNINLEINIKNEDIFIQNIASKLIYIVLKIFSNLSTANVQNVTIEAEKISIEENKISIYSNTNFNSINIEELKYLSEGEKINILNSDGKIEILF